MKRLFALLCMLLLPASLVFADIPLRTAGAITTTYGYSAYPTGTLGYDTNAAGVGNQYIFMLGVANCTTRTVVAIDHDGTTTLAAVLLTEAVGAKGRSVAISQAAIDAGLYGWFQIKGDSGIKVAATDVVDTQQYCSATAGTIDDSGVVPILGLHLAAASGSGTGTAYVVYPTTEMTIGEVPLTAANVTTTYGYALYPPGTRGVDASGNEYVFTIGVASTAAADVVAITNTGNTSTTIARLTTTNGALGYPLGVAKAAVTANLYGWIQVKGLTYVSSLANSPNVEYLCTPTGGMIAPAAVPNWGTGVPIHGIAVGDGTGATANAYILYPHTGN